VRTEDEHDTFRTNKYNANLLRDCKTLCSPGGKMFTNRAMLRCRCTSRALPRFGCKSATSTGRVVVRKVTTRRVDFHRPVGASECPKTDNPWSCSRAFIPLTNTCSQRQSRVSDNRQQLPARHTTSSTTTSSSSSSSSSNHQQQQAKHDKQQQ